MDDNSQQVRTRQLSWEEICRRAWGKDWQKPEPAYEFTGRKFDDNPNPYRNEE